MFANPKKIARSIFVQLTSPR